MPQLYDATLKELFEKGPGDWLEFLGLDYVSVDADLSAVTAGADKIFAVEGEYPWILHLEAQSSRDEKLPRRTHRYNTLIEDPHELLVRSVIVLLRKEADSPSLTGVYRRAFPEERAYLIFEYRVVRLLEVPVSAILTGGLGTLPLAALADLGETPMPTVIDRMKQLLADAPPDTRNALWGATYLLLGLRLPEQVVGELLQGVIGMRESSTYQAILREGREEGRVEEVRRLIAKLGVKRFGPLNEANKAILDAIEDVDALEEISVRLLDVENWSDLLKPMTNGE